MNTYSEAFQKYIRDHPVNYGGVNIDSLMEMFFWCYWESNPMETEEIKGLFREVDKLSPEAAEHTRDDLFNLVCQLCLAHEKNAFLEGFRAGGQWMLEMGQNKC